MKQILSIVAAIAISLSLVAQNNPEKGILTGQIVDKKSGETIIGATVIILETGQGTITDLDGNYSLNVEPGIYNVKTSYVSYTNQTIEGVEVKAGEETRINVALSSNTDLDEIVVRAEAINNNDVALVAMQRKSLNVQDGISVGEMKSLGVSNAAQAMKRIPGTAVEDGKYMVVRGLGDRYSITLLDGIILPSVDPYRNSTSLDLIPAASIDNVIIKKSYTPDMPGNFAGGVADITTKSLPTSKYFSIGASIGYNTNSTFNSNFLRDDYRGSTDWLGYDDGGRNVPQAMITYSDELSSAAASTVATEGRVPANEKQRQILNETAKSFKTSYVPVAFKPTPAYSFDLSAGNIYKLGGGELGVNIGLKYSKSFSHYENGIFKNYDSNTDSDGNFQPILERSFNETQSEEETNLGGLASVSYKINATNRITLKNLYSHIGNGNVTDINGSWQGGISSPGAILYSTGNTRTERSLNFTSLSGTHLLENANELKVDWSVAYNTSIQEEPDLRFHAYVEEEGNYSIKRSETQGDPKRYFRNLVDNQITGKIDFTLPVKVTDDKELKVQWGAYYSNKQREFSEQFFEVPLVIENPTNPSFVTVNEAGGDMTKFFAASNFGFVDNPESNGTNFYHGFGNYYSVMTIPANQYTGSEIITSGYAMASYPLLPTLKVVGGLRVEYTDMLTENEGPETVTIPDPNNSNELIEVSSNGEIKSLDFLPALNLIYNVTEKTNLRVGFSQTIARPNMREISRFVSYNLIGGLIESGNPALDRTLIQNYDIRFETYPNAGELFAVSAYYKNFNSPIIPLIYSNGSVLERTSINVESAFVTGIEVEFRKKLDFIAESLKSFRIAANASYIYSRVDKSETELSQLEGYEGAPSIQRDWRPFQGQSPYLVNVALFHNSQKLNWENSISINVFGRRLAYQTPALIPDVYETPRPSLNFKTSKLFGDHLKVSFTASNLLNMNYRTEFDFDVDGVDNTYKAYRLGRTFELGVSYSL